MDLEKKLSQITKTPWIFKYWLDEVKILEKKDKTIIFSDFDYTIFSRDEELIGEKYLRENRGDLGPKALSENSDIKSFIKKYFINKVFPKTIINKLNIETDVIITTGLYEFQIAKIIACKLNKYNIIITKNSTDKIIESIRYVIYSLKYIPSKIIIYEDRPENFIKYKDLIESVLGTKLIIKKVTMMGNYSDPIIKNI